MSEYHRNFVPGGTYFFTVVTHGRQPLFSSERNVQALRASLRAVQAERPFTFHAGVVLPDHLHFLWSLPHGDHDYSKRIGRMKVFFTRRTTREQSEPRSESRRKHREQNVWQRRFWEHTIRDEQDFATHFDYVHYNAVKHGHATCPHLWKHSSFARWVARGVYDEHWGCSCDGRIPIAPDFRTIEHSTGE